MDARRGVQALARRGRAARARPVQCDVALLVVHSGLWRLETGNPAVRLPRIAVCITSNFNERLVPSFLFVSLTLDVRNKEKCYMET
jgi:hypothetical protein